MVDIKQLQDDLAKAKAMLKLYEEGLRSAERQGEDTSFDSKNVKKYKKEVTTIEAELKEVKSDPKYKMQQGLGALKKFGSGAAGVIGKVGSKMLSKKSSGTSPNPKPSSPTPVTPKTFSTPSLNSQSLTNLFLIIALIFHFYDFRYNSYSVATFPIMLIPYIFLTLFGLFFVFRPSTRKGIGTIILVSLAALGVPRLIGWGLNFANLPSANATMIIALFPIWLLFLYSNQEYSTKFIRICGAIVFFGVIVVLIFYLITSGSFAASIISADLDGEGLDTGGGLQKIKDIFNPAKIADRVSTFKSDINAYINQSLGMDHFKGRVEQNENTPLGVYLEDLRPSAPTYYNGSDIVVWAIIRGKSFEREINTINGCYARKGNDIVPGIIEPRRLELFFDESRPLTCTFSEEYNNTLDVGFYTVTFTSNFDFETWGYVEYVYIDRDTLLQYYQDKKNINFELSIPRKSTAIYTNGPAGIGIISLDLPIGIDSDNLKIPIFGATLENKWPQGEIVTIKNMTILVPEGIQFSKCTPMWVSSSDSFSTIDIINRVTTNTGLNSYTFTLDSSKSGGNVNFFTTVTCNSNLSNPSGYPSNFLGNNIKVTKTFAVQAIYGYVLDESTNIKVEKTRR